MYIQELMDELCPRLRATLKAILPEIRERLAKIGDDKQKLKETITAGYIFNMTGRTEKRLVEAGLRVSVEYKTIQMLMKESDVAQGLEDRIDGIHRLVISTFRDTNKRMVFTRGKTDFGIIFVAMLARIKTM